MQRGTFDPRQTDEVFVSPVSLPRRLPSTDKGPDTQPSPTQSSPASSPRQLPDITEVIKEEAHEEGTHEEEIPAEKIFTLQMLMEQRRREKELAARDTFHEVHEQEARLLFESPKHQIPKAYELGSPGPVKSVELEKNAIDPQQEIANITANTKDAQMLQELVQACRRDYQRSVLFKRSPFLTLSKQGKMCNLPKVLEYIKQHPKSRTARHYMHLSVAALPADEYKIFWQKYLQKYSFSRFRKSKLIEKFLAGKIKNMEDIREHVRENPRSRSHGLLMGKR